MNIQFPRPLAAGSKIAIVAPSSGVAPALFPRLQLVLANLRAHGFHPVESSCLRGDTPPPAEVRAEAWMEALLRDDFDAVFPPWGGELAIEVLPRLDFDRLARARPKWILGYSDISTLLVPMLLKLGWASAHGPNLMDLVPRQKDPLSARTLSFLTSEERFEQHSSTHFQTAWVDWKAHPDAPFRLEHRSHCVTLDGQPLRARGRLVGGCLDTLSNLVGTPFGDVPAFVRAHRDDGVILFLENCELPPGQAARALSQLHLAGWFEGVSAIVLGRSQAPDSRGPGYVEWLRARFADVHAPVVFDADIGHVPPQWTLLEGALATLSVEAGRATIVQER